MLTSGGVSTGEADHVRSAVEAIGRLVFWRVAVKPGRPVAMGVIPGSTPGNGAAFVGLPGNPVAAFVTFARVVRPLMARLAGAEATALIALPVRATFAHKKKKGRREYVRVKLRRASDGVIEAVRHAQEGAGVITSLTETDGLVELLEAHHADRARRQRRVSVICGVGGVRRPQALRLFSRTQCSAKRCTG